MFLAYNYRKVVIYLLCSTTLVSTLVFNYQTSLKIPFSWFSPLLQQHKIGISSWFR